MYNIMDVDVDVDVAGDVAEERSVWMSLLKLLPRDPDLDKRQKTKWNETSQYWEVIAQWYKKKNNIHFALVWQEFIFFSKISQQFFL